MLRKKEMKQIHGKKGRKRALLVDRQNKRTALHLIFGIIGGQYCTFFAIYRWYGRFSRGEIHFDEAPRRGRPRSTKTDIVLASVQSNPSQSLRGMERTTSAPRSTIHDILRRRRFRAALPAVIPHTLTESERQVRVDVCRKLLDHKRRVAWTIFIIAQDKKWISYESPHRKLQRLPIDTRPEAVAKRRAHANEEMISFFFCSAGCFYYEILPEGTAVTARVFCEQLREMVSGARVSHRIQGKFLILMDNPRPHHARATAEELERLGITWLPHPPYSHDLSPCGYHASRSLQAYLKGRKFHNRQEIKSEVDE
uniref:Transposase n=1 Tax=Haemonchus contortus TaxID=6289 RepID=A0A7I4YAL8_HAECO